jgi:hypothetical protein
VQILLQMRREQGVDRVIGDEAAEMSGARTVFGGFVPVILTFLAEHFGTGLAIPMIIGTWIGCIAWAVAVFYGPETKGRVLVPDLVIA